MAGEPVAIKVESGDRSEKKEADANRSTVLRMLRKGQKDGAGDLQEKKRLRHDFRPDVDKAKIDAAALAKAGQLEDAIEVLMKVEKKTRHASEWEFTIELALFLIGLCFEKGWDEYATNIQMVCKRRQQHRTVVAAVVKDAIPHVDKTPDRATKLSLLECLRTVSEGKIFLEVERARLTRTLSEMQESEGQLKEAAKTLQEVAVETYGTMENKEKVDFILEQVRLCLLVKDYIRAHIISKKIDRNAIRDKSLQTLKLKFYKLLVEYHTHENQTLELCRDFLAMVDTPCVQSDRQQRNDLLAHACLFCVLSEYGSEQWGLLNRVSTEHSAKLAELPTMKALLKAFLTDEIAPWPLAAHDAYMKHPIFNTEVQEENTEQWGERRAEWREMLHKRVLQHNIRVVSRYYTRIELKRLAELCKLSVADAEAAIRSMVCVDDADSEPLYARIDRPSGIVSFVKRKDPNEMLSSWGAEIGELLGLVEKTKHLIDREMMAHNAAK